MGQALSSHALLLAGTHVGGSDHAGTLGTIRMMIRGELASGHGSSRVCDSTLQINHQLTIAA